MIFLLWSRKYGITDWFVSPQFYVETLTPSVTIFGDEASNQEVKVKWGLNPVGLKRRTTRDAYPPAAKD